MAITAPVSLSENRVRKILALSKREFDDREAKMKTTMVTTKFTPSDESVLKKGYRAIRSANGPDTYEITVPSDVASNMRRDWPYAVLSEGDARQQIGCVTVDQNGCAITKFSRSESGQRARRRFETGDDALSIAYLHSSSGRKPAAFSMRAVSDGKSKKEKYMSDLQEIARLGAKHGQSGLATQAIAAGQTLAEFRNDLLDKVSNTPLDAPTYIESGQRQYNLGNLIRASITGDRSKAGFELEVAQELERNHPTGVRGTMVPWQAFSTRATMTSTSVANLTASMPMGATFVDALQPASAALQAGATTLSLSKAISVPKQTGSLTASWTAEGAAVSESALTIGTFSMSPKRLSATASYTLESLVQSDPSLDVLTRRDMARMLARGIDTAAVSGSGASG